MNRILATVVSTILLIHFVSTLSIATAQDGSKTLLEIANQRKYDKKEVRIPMRDGVTLYTVIYSPKDQTKKYPIMFSRTPYGCWPYGEAMPDKVMYNPALVESGYIFVYQDLRSRSMSDGDPIFENLKPARSLADSTAIDEVTDAKDSLDWLVKNFAGHNGRIGMFGSSYIGYTSLMGAVSGHPKLKAVLSAAPSMDIFFEDFNRNGLFTLAYVPILDWFGTPKYGRHEGPWWRNNLSYWADKKRFGLAKDSYQFFLNKGALSNFDNLIPRSNYLWKAIKEHPNYDEYRKARNAVQYLRGIKSPILIVGSWNDEQNLFGMLKSYQAIVNQNNETDCRLVIGPWSHSGHKNRGEALRVGNVFFGNHIVDRYQRDIEFAFFERHLKEKNARPIPKVSIFDTGLKRWSFAERFPPKTTEKNFYVGGHEQLRETLSKDSELRFEFVSDPAKPVPYIESDQFNLFPSKDFMTSDQRFASKRPDVLTFVTEPLKTDFRVVGKIQANLKFSTNRSDADLMVKLIDVLPMDRTPKLTDIQGLKMNGYQQLVRLGQIRGRFRESYSAPKPFISGQVSDVPVELLDVCHTFKAGHRIMIQIQSSLFPLFDRNPQNYVDNIYKAKDADFIKATHTIHAGSHIRLGTLTPESLFQGNNNSSLDQH